MVSAQNYVRNFDFVQRIWSQLHNKDCLYIYIYIYIYIYSHFQTLILFHIFTSRDGTFSLLHFDFQQSTPHKWIHSATFFFHLLLRLASTSNTTTEISSNPKRDKQPTWEKTCLLAHVAIFLYIDTLYEILSLHTFYSLQDTFNISSFSIISVLVHTHTHRGIFNSLVLVTYTHAHTETILEYY